MKALIAALALSLPAAAQAPPSALPSATITAAFEIACGRQLADCSAVEEPRVYFSDLSGLGAWGVYPWPGVILIDASLLPGLIEPERTDVLAFSILVHEMAHHVDFATGALVLGNATSVCQSEARAWHVSNGWLASVGAGELARWHWAEGYEVCR